MSVLFWILLAAGANQQSADPDPQQPSMELLEFLGSFETIDGDWLDPMSFEEQYDSDTKAQEDETHKDEISSQDSDPDPARLH